MEKFKSYILEKSLFNKVSKKLSKMGVDQDQLDVLSDEIAQYFDDTGEDFNKTSDKEFKKIVKFIQKELKQSQDYMDNLEER